MIKEIQDKEQKRNIANIVLTNLIEWFEIEEYRNDYINKSGDLPFFAAYMNDQPVGFITMKETSKYACELHCMGVLKEHHHKGFGQDLYNAMEQYAIKRGYKFLQVKTVKQGIYESYDKTNMFYQAMGFYELEVFDTLWDEHNPCQVFVKSLV
ncbi:MAG: GNAT family N-acetyltransferase [Candidatus Izemoplasmataceae bacterium]